MCQFAIADILDMVVSDGFSEEEIFVSYKNNAEA
jgi:hypothetical protein